MIVPDPAHLQLAADIEAETIVGTGQEELPVPARRGPVLQQRRPGVGVGEDVLHQHPDLPGPLLGEPRVIGLRAQLVDLVLHAGLVHFESLDAVEEVGDARRRGRSGLVSRLVCTGGGPGHDRCGRKQHAEIHNPMHQRFDSCGRGTPSARPKFADPSTASAESQWR